MIFLGIVLFMIIISFCYIFYIDFFKNCFISICSNDNNRETIMNNRLNFENYYFNNLFTIVKNN
jgi:hypothetical protein